MRIAFLMAVVGIGAAWMAQAQSTTTSITDASTPAAVAAGIPSSSYALSNIDTVDPYTGSVNIHIPLYKVGGRGEAGYPIMLLLEQKWRTVTHMEATPAQTYYVYPEPGAINNAMSYYLPTIVEYTPGLVFSRLSTDASAGTIACTAAGAAGNGYTYFYGELLTRLTFLDGTGTEHELVDTQSNGQPIALSPPPNCGTDPLNGGTDRGRMFRSTDGTDLLFVSDSDVRDQVSRLTKVPELAPVMMSGWLYFPDGHKFRIDSGNVSSITDRNGNQTTISGGTVTDPLGRTIQIATGATAGAADTITYPGANGAQRQIVVNYTLLQNALASGQALETPLQLFPTLLNASTTTYNPWVVQSVVLPDQTAYTFEYNSYGEVAHMTLPTGGAISYQYPATMNACQGSSPTGCVMNMATAQGAPVGLIQRRVLQRNEYANGSAPSRQTIYSYAVTSQENTQVTMTEEDGSGNILAQTQHIFQGDSWAPDLSGTATAYYSGGGMNGKEVETVTLSGSGQVLRDQTQAWAERACAAGNWPQTGGGAEPCWWTGPFLMDHDPQLVSVTTTESGWQKKSSYAYDQNNNQTDDYEYDWGSGAAGSLLKHTVTSYNTAASYSSLNLLDLASEVKVYNGSGSLQADTQYAYDGNGIANEPGIIGHDNVNYAGAGARGNVTSAARCTTPGSCGWLTTQFSYDIAGNTISVTDANGHTTSYGYADNYSDGKSRNTYGHVTSKTNALGQTAKWQWDYSLGKLALASDINGVNTTYSYNNDALDRLKSVVRAAGLAGFETETQYGYQPYTGAKRLSVTTNQDQFTFGKGELQTVVFYDGLGREVETDEYESATSYIATVKTYDALGRLKTVTNPSRPGDGLNYVTTYGYDALNRVTSVATADGAVAATSYAGATTTRTDQAGHARQGWADGLGRLVKVVEDPGSSPHLNYVTSYSYDALDDLAQATQCGTTSAACTPSVAGSETRTFRYDGLGRLTQSTNPESGAVSYSYDAVGNLLRKTDARSVQTSDSYDVLNRVTQKTYSDGTSAVHYQYDAAGAGYSWGRLTKVWNGNSATQYTSIDPLGRVTGSNQQSGGETYAFSYSYNLAGSLTSETYPTGRVVTTGYDGANRAYTVAGSLAGQATTYAGWVSYWPHGAEWGVGYGNGLVPVTSYNSRLQLQTLSVTLGNTMNVCYLQLTYDWGAANDNGNLLGVVEGYGTAQPCSALSTLNQNYSYDAVNRLTGISDSGYERTFGYDAFGNGWVTGNVGVVLAGNTPTAAKVFNGNNQTAGVRYDAAGNQLGANGDTLSYDAENRQSAAAEPASLGGGTETYLYDGDGQRVEKTGPAGTTVYVYDALGRLAAEYGTNGAASPCTTCYLVADHLGTPRLVMDQNADIIARHDYLPFGEEIPANTAGRNGLWGPQRDAVHQKFTGKERDAETGLDFFGARYYGMAIARFMSPDPGNAGAEPSDPESWNAYSYAGNNPLNQTDPDGLDYHVCLDDGNGGQQCTNIASDQAFQQAAQNPGAGLSVSGDAQSGTIYAADENGNQVQVGTYQQFVGPGTEGGGLQQGYGIELAGAGLAARALGAGATLGEGLLGVFGRLGGAGVAEDAAAAAGGAFRAGVTEVLERASSVAGNQQIRVASEDVAKQAAEEFLGPGSREITQQYGNRAGQVVGRISQDGQRVVRADTNAATPHYNFVNKTTMGNLHVYF